MILKAFAEFLKKSNEKDSSTVLLALWLKNKLSQPVEDNVDKVIHEEISIVFEKDNEYRFEGKSKTGKALLKSLYNFALSYEQQKFTRWVHNLKASDFKKLYD